MKRSAKPLRSARPPRVEYNPVPVSDDLLAILALDIASQPKRRKA